MSDEEGSEFALARRFSEIGRAFMSSLEKEARNLSVEKNGQMRADMERLSVVPIAERAFRISRGSSAKCDFVLHPGWNLIVRCPPEDAYKVHKDTPYLVKSSLDGCHIFRGLEEVSSKVVLEEAFRDLLKFEIIDYV